MREWWWSNFLLLLLLISACSHDSGGKKEETKISYVEIANKILDLHLVLPSQMKESYDLTYPVSGARLIDKKDQIYGFVSIKELKFTNSSDEIGLLEENYDYDWDNFTSHWESFLNARGIELQYNTSEYGLSRDIYGNLTIHKRFELDFPGTLSINAAKIGDYAEQVLAKKDISSSVTPQANYEGWFEASNFQVSFSEALIVPSSITEKYKIIVTFLVTPQTKANALFEKVGYDLIQSSNMCVGNCTLIETNKIFTQPITTSANILFLFKNTLSMQTEINNSIEYIQKPLLTILNQNKIPYRVAIATLSNPQKLLKINNKYWISPGDDPDEFFKVPVTSSYIRNALIEKAPLAVSTAVIANLFKADNTKTIVFVSDRDDQSVTPSGAPISSDNLTEFVNVFDKEKITPFGIVSFSDTTRSLYCDNPEPANILKRFIFLMGGESVDICHSERYNFFSSLIQYTVLTASSMKFNVSPIKSTMVVKSDGEKITWGFPKGYFVDSETKSLVIFPLPQAKVEISYMYYQKKF